MDAADLASRIDHTLLGADATPLDVRRTCREARRYGFAAVCVASSWLPLAREALRGSDVMPITVAGFPLGASATEVKAFETREAVRRGAREVDVVIHLGRARAGDWEGVEQDLRAVVEAAGGCAVKAILETGLLDEEQVRRAAKAALAAGAAFVKTSTGFGPGGATVEAVRLLRRVVGRRAGVKASGGVRTREQARALLAAGADRLGASASVAIVTGRPG